MRFGYVAIKPRIFEKEVCIRIRIVGRRVLSRWDCSPGPRNPLPQGPTGWMTGPHSWCCAGRSLGQDSDVRQPSVLVGHPAELTHQARSTRVSRSHVVPVHVVRGVASGGAGPFMDSRAPGRELLS